MALEPWRDKGEREPSAPRELRERASRDLDGLQNLYGSSTATSVCVPPASPRESKSASLELQSPLVVVPPAERPPIGHTSPDPRPHARLKVAEDALELHDGRPRLVREPEGVEEGEEGGG